MTRTLAARVLALLALTAGCASCSSPSHDAAPAPVVTSQIFDGTSLTGWTKRGGNAEFRVENGEIVGETRPKTPNTFLCTQRTFRNFILELEFKVDPSLNSGIQIRSESLPDYRKGVVHGYQVEIDPSARAWTAGIYDEARRGWLAAPAGDAAPRAPFHQNDWNTLRIEADGPRLRTWLNGVAVADLTDAMTPEGFIALQVHDVGDRADPLRVRWRNLRLKELP